MSHLIVIYTDVPVVLEWAHYDCTEIISWRSFQISRRGLWYNTRIRASKRFIVGFDETFFFFFFFFFFGIVRTKKLSAAF